MPAAPPPRPPVGPPAGLDAEWYRAVFTAGPAALVLFDRDLVVLDVNEPYLEVTGTRRRDLLGRVLFDPFPGDPAAPDRDDTAPVRASVRRAADSGRPDVLVAQRYDLPVDDPSRPGAFEPRYWNLTTVPVPDVEGTVRLLVHRVEDVTPAVDRAAAEASAQRANADLRQRVASAQAALLDRAQELQRLNDRLRVAGDHDRTVARALQAAMLPRLPDVDGLDLVGRYFTAEDQDQVGGDWYDAVVSPDGATTLITGDVTGHDIAAAATMGQVRSMLRAFTWDHGQPPSRVVTLLDHAMRDLGLTTMTSLVVVVVDPGGGDAGSGDHRVRWTNAGHPPPLLVDADGAVTVLTSAPVDVLLGVAPDRPRHDHTHTVPRGSTLLLYTDGLVETRDADLDDGLARLCAALRGHYRRPVAAMLDAVIAEMVGGHPDDDVAAVAVRFDGER